MALDAPLARIAIHVLRATQIAALKQDKALIKVPAKSSDFSDIISAKEALMLSEQTKFNKHAIKLERNKQPSCRPIYSLNTVELITLKTFIETHLKIEFIQSSKFSAGA